MIATTLVSTSSTMLFEIKMHKLDMHGLLLNVSKQGEMQRTAM